MSSIPAVWFMEAEALGTWLRQTSERMRLGSAVYLDWDPGRNRPYELLDGGIAVIPISGALSKADRWWSLGSSYKAIGNQIRQALEDASVRHILLDVDSPGGDAAGVQELASIIAAADLAKPVYAWADGQCCSAAYWLASAARTLAVNPATEVGSIGVVGIHLEITKAAESAGYTFTVIRSGKEKAFGNSYERLSPDALASIQARFDGLYALFIQGVAANRGLDAAQAGNWAEGRVFLAADALAAGLVDRLQNRDDFIASIREANMDKKTLQLQHPDLYQAVVDEGRQAAAADAAPSLETARTEAAQAARNDVVALAGVLGGDELKNKLEEALAAGLTGEALAKAAGVLGAVPGSGQDRQDGSLAQDMLAALKGADAGGVAPASAKAKGQKGSTVMVDYMTQKFGGAK
jgi:signal peptide peptidase SppA